MFGQSIAITLKPKKQHCSSVTGNSYTLGHYSVRRITSLPQHINKELLCQKSIETLTHGDLAKVLFRKLNGFTKKYRKGAEEVADVFVRLSGDVESMDQYFMTRDGCGGSTNNASGRHFYTEWSQTEDLALMRAKDSSDYNVLAKTKGLLEIEKRRAFLRGEVYQQHSSQYL